MFNRKIGTISKKIHTPYEGMFGLGTQGYEKEVTGTTYIDLTNALANKLISLKLFGGAEQRNVPTEYTEVNYVTNSAKTWLDTGIKFDFSKNYEIELRARGTLGSWYMLQARESDSSTIYGISGSTSNNNIILAFNGGKAATTQIMRVDGNIYYIKGTINNGNLTLYVKDETAGTEETVTGTYTASTGQTVNIGLFGNGVPALTPQSVDINSDVYYARIKEDGNYILNYFPCKQSTTAGFYDKVTNTFKTTTDLVAGTDVTVPTPATPMDIVSNNGTLKVRNKSGLPLGYQKIEYLESTGTQYIDTGIILKSEATIETVAELTQIIWSSGPYSFWGFMGSNSYIPRWGWSVYQNRWLPDLNSTTQVYSPVVDRNKHTFINTCYYTQGGAFVYDAFVDGVSVYEAPRRIDNIEDYTSNALSVYIFGRNNVNVVGNFIGAKIYSYKIIQDNILVLDLIPCRRNSDNVLGMYDLVSGNFLTNQGTGTFTAGSDIDDLEIYTDGTVETVGIRAGSLVDNTITGANINTSGEIASSSASFEVHTAPVTPGETYTCNEVAVLAYYTSKPDIGSVSYNNSRTVTTSTTFTVPNDPTIKYVAFRNSTDNSWIVKGPTKYNGGTATAEMLLKVGNYADTQEILSGAVSRNVGIKVLDGTESWSKSGLSTMYYRFLIPNATSNWGTRISSQCYCTHVQGVAGTPSSYNQCGFSADFVFHIGQDEKTVAEFKQWLADQYAAGTPVIVVYPLETPTTETVTGQSMNIQSGTNTIEITQASIDNLPLYAKYKASS